MSGLDAFIHALRAPSVNLTRASLPAAPVEDLDTSKVGQLSLDRVDQIAQAGNVDANGGTKRPRTRPITGAVATSNDGFQTTGPLAEKLPQRRQAGVNLWAVAGATIRVYNTQVLDKNGNPKLIAEGQAPDETSAPRNWSVSYPAQRTYDEAMRRFSGKQQDGQILVALELPPEADWHGSDQLAITQQVGAREESLPIKTRSIYYTTGNNRHDTYVLTDRLDIQLGGCVGQSVNKPLVRSTADYAASPGALVQFHKDGFAVGERKTVDESGQFSIEFPGDPRDGTWELKIGSKTIPITGRSESPAEKRERVERTIREAILQPSNGEIRFSIKGLPDGFTLEVNNPSTDEGPQSFRVDDASNVLDVCITNAFDGDTLAFSSAQEAAPGFKIDRDWRVPTPAEKARIDTVLSAVPDASERDVRFALELFGPWSSVDALAAIADPAQIQSAFAGAKLGTVIGRRGFHAAIKSRIERTDEPFQKGYAAGIAYRGTEGRYNDADVGLVCIRQGERSIAVRGGYNMLKGTGTPLHPVTVTQPSTFELTLPGADKFTFRAGGSENRF